MPEFFLLMINLFAIIGIGLEIWGFVWLLTYSRNPRREELNKWTERKKIEDNLFYFRHEPVDMEIKDNPYFENWPKKAPKEFRNMWESRRKWSILLVIIGLSGQLIQITSSTIIQFFS